MAYRLFVTERAEELLDSLVYHLLLDLNSEQAAEHLLNSLEKIYERLEENPFQFPKCNDIYLKRKRYRKAVITDMDYLVIFGVSGENVYVMGIFHQLENYQSKV